MTVISGTKEDRNVFVRELIEAKERVELQHESLIRHQSGIAATLIGIIAVFVDMSQESMFLRCLTVASVLFLLLTVLAGVLYCFLQYELKLKALSNCLRQYQEGTLKCCGSGFFPNRFIACQSVPMAVVRGNTTSIGKRSMCSTVALSFSLISSFCIFSSINYCVLENCYYLCKKQ